MGTITRSIKCIFIIQFAIYQVSSHNPQPISQYLLSNLGPTLAGQYQNVPRPTVPQPTLANAASVPLPKPAPVNPKPKETLSSGPLDSNVLNNLAIALQLLIVSNILNMPAVEPGIPNTSKLDLSIPKSVHNSPYTSYSSLQSPMSSLVEQALSKTFYEASSKPLYSYESPSKPLYSYEAPSQPLYSYEPPSKPLYSYEVPSQPLYSYEPPSKPLYSYEAQSKPLYSYEAQLPNANFLGSSFAEPASGSASPRPNPRSSMTLMSPYDALGTSSFGDQPSSSFSSYGKNDFQSPYASILAADSGRDVFSMADFF